MWAVAGELIHGRSNMFLGLGKLGRPVGQLGAHGPGPFEEDLVGGIDCRLVFHGQFPTPAGQLHTLGSPEPSSASRSLQGGSNRTGQHRGFTRRDDRDGGACTGCVHEGIVGGSGIGGLVERDADGPEAAADVGTQAP